MTFCVGHQNVGRPRHETGRSMKGILESRLLFRVLLSLPAAIIVYDYSAGTLTYGEFIHASGDWSARLLLAALAVSPVRMLMPRARVSRWLLARRRDLGVATFCYAALHTLVYVARKADFNLIVTEGAGVELLTGWLALVVFATLAITSNDASVRMLKANWAALHRLVYLGAILMFAHWILTAFDPLTGLIYSGIFILIVAARIVLTLWRARRRVTPA